LSGIGLVVALPRELPSGFAHITAGGTEESSGLAVYRLATAGCQIAAVRAGVGERRAAVGAHFLVRRFSPRALVSFGFAGGLRPELGRGTLIVGQHLVSTESNRPLADADRGLVEQFFAAARTACLPVQRGAIVTADHIVTDASCKAALACKSGADAVDMETKGMVEVASQAGLAWVALRAIVDTAEEILPAECLRVLRTDGRVALGRLMRDIPRSPWLIWHLFRLARSAALARRHLCRALKQWIETLPLHLDQGGR
jgi:adenosylhomocysteine nucleosidase